MIEYIFKQYINKFNVSYIELNNRYINDNDGQKYITMSMKIIETFVHKIFFTFNFI